VLRGRKLGGFKWRRQAPIGPYIVDFLCVERQLVVELDGGQHDPVDDAGRSRLLEARGFTVLRFWNNAVFEQQLTVLAVIFDALSSKQPRARSVARQSLQARRR
jgi:adenine-specific DNA-methyltransferase